MSNTEKKPKQKKRIAYHWMVLLLVFAFFRFTDQGTVVQGWLQQAVLATGLIEADVKYAENHDTPANFNLQLTSLDGQILHLEDLRGKVIFMNFWATWCPPCLAEMPFIQSLYEDEASEDIAFLIISTDENAEIARRFIEARQYTFPVYRLTGQVPDMYNVRSLPTTFVISPQGNMATVHYGMANYNTKGFKAFLKEMAPPSPEDA